MPNDIFTKLDAKQAAAALRDVNPLWEGAGFDAASATILMQPLAFFPGWRLLDIGDFSQLPAARCQALHKPGAATAAPGTTIILDGSNRPIYRLAREAPIVLDAERAAAYVRFFFGNVHMQGRRFIIAETVDDIPWLGEPPAPLRKEAGRRLLPLTAGKDGSAYRLSATVLSGTGLFAIIIVVAPDGIVSIAEQTVLIEELAVRDGVIDA